MTFPQDNQSDGLVASTNPTPPSAAKPQSFDKMPLRIVACSPVRPGNRMEKIAGRKRLMKRQASSAVDDDDSSLLSTPIERHISSSTPIIEVGLQRVSGKKRLMKRQQQASNVDDDDDDDDIFKDDLAREPPSLLLSPWPPVKESKDSRGTLEDLDFGPLESILEQDDLQAFRDILRNRLPSSSKQLPLHSVLQRAIERGAEQCADAVLSLSEGAGDRSSCRLIDTSRSGCHFLSLMLKGKHRLRCGLDRAAPTIVSPLIDALNALQHGICGNICGRFPLHCVSVLRRHCPQLLIGQEEESEQAAAAEVNCSLVNDRGVSRSSNSKRNGSKAQLQEEVEDVEDLDCYDGSDLLDDDDDNEADAAPPTLLFQLISKSSELLVPAILAGLSGAARGGAIGVHAVRALLRHTHKYDQSSILHWAAEEGSDLLVEALLDADPMLCSARDRHMCTPLHAACMMGELKCAELLLGCSPELVMAKDAQGWTPFLYCLFYEKTNVAMHLLQGGDLELSLEQFRALSHLTEIKGGDDRWKRCLETLATVPEFHSLINKLIKENVYLLSGDLQFVKEYPFLLNMENKLVIGEHFLQLAEEKYRESFPIKGVSSMPAHRIQLERSDPWRSLVQFCDGERDVDGVHGGANLRRGGWEMRLQTVMRSSIQFSFRADANEVGVGQGVEREVLELTSTCMANYKSPLGLFRSSGDASQALEPINTKGLLLARVKQHYRYFGMLLAHCILRCLKNGRITSNILNINLKNTFWKLLLQKKPTIDDLADADAQIYQSLNYIRENIDAENLDLYFTVSDEEFDLATGKSIVSSSNLKPGGEGIRVTDANKEEYVALMVRHCTEIRMVLATENTRRGLLSVLPLSVLSLFSEHELGMMFSSNSKIDAKDWMTHTLYTNYSTSDPVIKWFWQFVLSLTSSEKGLLLRFTTGSSRLPPGGFADLTPAFTITRTHYDATRGLPTAATCFNLLKLPAYGSEYELKKFVHTAVSFGSEGFSFS